MTQRSVLEEIRRVRHAVSSKIGHDPHRIVQYYADLQKSFGGRVVNFSGESHAGQTKDCIGEDSTDAPLEGPQHNLPV